MNVTDYSVSLDGYSVPFLFRDAQDQTQLLVGSEQGEIFYYPGVDEINYTGAFEPSDTLAGLIGIENLTSDRGYRSAPALFDLDQDGHPELIAGNFSGGLEYFGINGGSPVSQIINPSLVAKVEVKVFPSPARDYITISCHDCQAYQSAGFYLYDFKGERKLHFTGSLEEDVRINLDLFPPSVLPIGVECGCLVVLGLRFESLRGGGVVALHHRPQVVHGPDGEFEVGPRGEAGRGLADGVEPLDAPLVDPDRLAVLHLQDPDGELGNRSEVELADAGARVGADEGMEACVQVGGEALLAPGSKGAGPGPAEVVGHAVDGAGLHVGDVAFSRGHRLLL